MPVELTPGLHRWIAAHPAWEPGAEPESPGDWPEKVGSVAYEGPDALVLVDPMVDGWGPLDALVERHGKPVAVLTTGPRRPARPARSSCSRAASSAARSR